MNEDQKKYLLYAVPVVVVIALGGALYYGKHRKDAVVTQPATAELPAEPAGTAPEHHPIETPAAEAPLPSLAESDANLQQSLEQVFGRGLDRYLVPKDIVRHIVVTVDNLPRKKTAVQMWPVNPLGGDLTTSGTDEVTLSDANYTRYKPIVALATSADAKQLVALYKRYYPLFQQAYVDLGYPDAYFNNRLIEVIDHLLETPEIEGPVKLVQPGVFYEFADASLESRSSGQKLLLRMGRDNAAAVKLKLREVRREVAKRE